MTAVSQAGGSIPMCFGDVAARRIGGSARRVLAAMCFGFLLSAGLAAAQDTTTFRSDSSAAGSTSPAHGTTTFRETPAAPAAADSAADDSSESDGGWPRLIGTPSGADMVLYQPQVLSWEAQRHMVAVSAVSYWPKGAKSPDLGTVKVESPTPTSVEERMVNFMNVDITGMNFPSLNKTESQEVLTEIRKSLPHDTLLVALDRILAMVDTTQISAKGVKINVEPPPIFYSTKEAILLQTDGEPIMAPIANTSLKYVINTNWDLFQDGDTKLWYLRNDTYWLVSEDFKKWKDTKKLPDAFQKLPDDQNWTDTKANIPGKKKGSTPMVLVSNKPSELVLVKGSPKTEKVEGTDLKWVKNTDSDLFRYEGKDKAKKGYYVLLSGRWFRTEKPEKGPWVFATADVPPDFTNIPRSHERARVLSSVPGTDEAAQAILLAQVPRTAQVDAKNLKAPDVTYDGEPKFKQIGSTTVSYAENTAFDVLKVGASYYLCHQGVWFIAQQPTGPWAVTTKVAPEIYAIPSDSPMQHVTYVTVVEDDANYPTYGYSAGYTGMTIAFGCAMWGTGFYYPPYYHYPGMGYPIYYPRPVAYGGGVAYNPWTGAYGGYQSAYGPYGGVSRAAAYNPSTGTYARAGMAYGPGGAAGYASAYNPRTGNGISTRQGGNVYASWCSTTVKRGDNWVNTQRTTDRNGNTKWKAQGSGGGGAAGWNRNDHSGFVGQKGDDVYAGRDGNVYKKGDNGWQQWGGAGSGGWNDVGGGGNRPSAGTQPAGGAGAGAGNRPSAGQQPATRPGGGGSGAPSAGQLDRDAQARSRGTQQTRDYGSYRSSGGSSSRGYSGSRGGSRGGGGRRR